MAVQRPSASGPTGNKKQQRRPVPTRRAAAPPRVRRVRRGAAQATTTVGKRPARPAPSPDPQAIEITYIASAIPVAKPAVSKTMQIVTLLLCWPAMLWACWLVEKNRQFVPNREL